MVVMRSGADANFFQVKGHNIVKIEAIKSPIRLGAYMFKREQFAAELGNIIPVANLLWRPTSSFPGEYLNERWLWHGTSEKIVNNIAHQGFLRQFLGNFGERNLKCMQPIIVILGSATDGGWYGCGIYFAPNACKSYAPVALSLSYQRLAFFSLSFSALPPCLCLSYKRWLRKAGK